MSEQCTTPKQSRSLAAIYAGCLITSLFNISVGIALGSEEKANVYINSCTTSAPQLSVTDKIVACAVTPGAKLGLLIQHAVK